MYDLLFSEFSTNPALMTPFRSSTSPLYLQWEFYFLLTLSSRMAWKISPLRAHLCYMSSPVINPGIEQGRWDTYPSAVSYWSSSHSQVKMYLGLRVQFQLFGQNPEGLIVLLFLGIFFFKGVIHCCQPNTKYLQIVQVIGTMSFITWPSEINKNSLADQDFLLSSYSNYTQRCSLSVHNTVAKLVQKRKIY